MHLHWIEIPERLEYEREPMPQGTVDVLAAAQLMEMLRARFWGHNDLYRAPEQRLRDAQPSAERIEETLLARSAELEDDDPRGGVVGIGQLVRCPGQGESTAWLWVGVDPRFRRRGIGARLHAELEAAARRRGCTVLQAWTDHRRLPGGTDVGEDAAALDEDAPDAGFARALGYGPVEREFVQVLHVDRLREAGPEGAAAQVRTGRAAHPPRAAAPGQDETVGVEDGVAEVEAGRLPGGCRLVAWAAPCPDAHVDEMARLRGLMDADAPSGGLAGEHAPWDAARYRAGEARRREAGESVFTVAAVDAHGRVLGHSDVEAYAARPDVAFQGATIVAGDHRGRGLGLRLKEAGLERFARVWPQAERIYTWNSTSNAPMLRVKAALGYEPAALCVAWRRRARS